MFLQMLTYTRQSNPTPCGLLLCRGARTQLDPIVHVACVGHGYLYVLTDLQACRRCLHYFLLVYEVMY